MGFYAGTVIQALQKGLPEVLAWRIGAWTVVPGSSLTHHHSERSFLHLQLTGYSYVEVGDDSEWENVPGENREMMMSVGAMAASEQTVWCQYVIVASSVCCQYIMVASEQTVSDVSMLL